MRAVLILALGVLAGAAQAQEYPSKPIKLVVPFAPGGAADIVGRLLADRLIPVLKQGVYIENVAGKGGMTGSQQVAKAPADGYTLLFATDVTLITGPILERAADFDPIASFAPISLVSSTAGAIAVSPSLPARNLEELVALIKASPGRYRYVTTGAGTSTSIGADLFKSLLKLDIREVRLRTWAEAAQALAGGGAEIVFANSLLLEQTAKEGRAKVVAIMGHAPLGPFPGVRTTAEQGVPGLTMYTWTGLVAPAGTPPAAIGLLNRAVVFVLNDPETKVTFGKYRLAAEGTPADWFQSFIRTEVDKWRRALPAS